MTEDTDDTGQLYMVIETFREGAAAVYRRLRQEGRQLPDGLRLMSSWVTEDLDRCYQVVECNRPAALEEWMEEWRDLVNFEIQPVLTSEEAQAAALNRSGG